ncbi:MAG: prepilin-type cleavage/methylation domain-containing protein [bacterium]|nr:prepilin-type cleavage/methylation domain-containing protein [bacterium]
MNQEKGFSLIEVLLCLCLISTTAIGILQQLQQSQIILNRLLLRTNAFMSLDHANEYLFVDKKQAQLNKSLLNWNTRYRGSDLILQFKSLPGSQTFERVYKQLED